MSSSSRRLLEVFIVAVTLAFSTAALGYESPVVGPNPNPWFDTHDRSDVIAAYTAEFSEDTPDMDWDGDHSSCEAGTSSPEYRQAAIRRVNYYRAMAGVLAGVGEEQAFSEKAQMAAVMMSVEGVLTHSPSDSFACFTATGQEAAANSNLYLGRTGPRAVDGYIEDPGDRNVDVGHRNTILHPPTRLMGVGDVDASLYGSSANALWVFDDRVFDEESPSLRPPMREADRFVAWPPRGYVPAPLVHPRWSFTAAGVDLSNAEVTMFRPWAPAGEREIPLEVINRSGAPGHVPLPTIVWEPRLEPEMAAPATDQLVLVVITEVTPTGSALPPDETGETIAVAHEPLPVPLPVADEAVETRAWSSYAYAVRIIGDEPGTELTVSQFLARLGTSHNP